MPVPPSHIAQVAIAVRDVARAAAFYRDTLGLTHLFDAPPGLSFFQCGETRLMLSQPGGPETAGNSILYYAVPSARAAHEDLSRAGVPFEEGPRRIAEVGGRDVWLAVARDSEGNLLGLMSEEAPEPAAA
ncbi:MAG: VOC family protein [Allosphingosinicella sp.]|uniref:VOC family protein n=1 Tax=Allosphingosinicella sp. TaxID=2823234 RepID=UPI00393D9512